MQEFEQHPGETLDYSVEFKAHCTRYREPNTDYQTNAVVQPRKATGLQYRAAGSGRTGSNEPRWPTTEGQAVTDGAVVWTAEDVSSESLARSLSSASWSVATGLTVGSPSTSGTKSTVLISGGTDGQDYDVTCTGTCSDGTYPVAMFRIKIRKPARTVDA